MKTYTGGAVFTEQIPVTPMQKCRARESRCPFKVDVVNRMQNAVELFELNRDNKLNKPI